MKKALSVLLALVLVLSMSFGALAAGKAPDRADKQNAKGTGAPALQKQFKLELNEQKKAIAQEKASLDSEKAALEAQYETLLAAGDAAGAEALLKSIEALDANLSVLNEEMKKIINERYMVIKTMYSEEDLAQFENAAALIEQMYADASALGAGSVVVKNNIIKFEAPPYIKGGKTIVPVRAITEALGAEVAWDEAAHAVTVTKDTTVVVFTLGSTTVTVNGAPVEITAPAELSCGMTYVPLRFLAETFGLDVEFDDETDTIEIDEPDETTPETPEVPEVPEA